MPALMWTTVPPAKSSAPHLKSMPASALTASSAAWAAALAASSAGGGQRLGGVADRVRAAPVPDHVGHREVDEGDPEDHEEHQRRELHALGEGADDQRRRDASRTSSGSRCRRIRGCTTPFEKVATVVVRVDALQEGLREAADEVVEAAAIGEGEAVAVDHPEQRRRSQAIAKTCVSTESMFLVRTRPP